MTTDFEPISGSASSYNWDREDVKALNHQDTEAIEELLMGHKVIKADEDHLLLDNGTVIKAIGHEGGCACSSGDYYLSELNGVDNIITRVEFDYSPGGDGEPGEGYYRIFVYADNERINLMQFDGSDGNGYYGTGFEILVREIEGGN